MTIYNIVSADGHVIEPPDMWKRFLPADLRHRAPVLVKDPEGGDAWQLAEGQAPMPIGMVTNTGLYGKRYEDFGWYGSTYDTIRQGAFRGKDRLEEQDQDGVSAEVIFPSQRTMGVFMAQEDDAFHFAGIDAYNSWLWEEFMAPDPTRLIGLAQMTAVDIKTSVARLQEAHDTGFRGVIVSAYPSGRPQLSPDDDPFWEVAEALEMPIHIHGGLPQAGKRNPTGAKAATARATRVPGLAEMGGAIGSASVWMSQFIYSGMFDRFPKLNMVAAEVGAGWVPHFLEHMDDHYWRNRVWTNTNLQLLPSDYFRRNWKTTFIREPFAVRARYDIGVQNMMWSSDYPHHRNDWPYSRRIIAESFGGVPEDERHAMTGGNAVELYGLA